MMVGKDLRKNASAWWDDPRAMPEAIDFVYGFCATSLVGYVVGWPVGHLGPVQGRRIRFFGAGALASGATLLVTGWPPLAAIPLALVGTAVAIGLDDLIRGADEPASEQSVPKSQPKSQPKAEASVKLPRDEDLPVPDLIIADEAAVSRSQKTMHGAPVAEPEAPRAKKSEWREPAESSHSGDIEAPSQAQWDEPGAAATGPLPVMGKSTMDDVDLEELYDEVDAALNVVPDECPHCAGNNPVDARFCKHCSAPLKPWRCNHCDRVNDIDASFCVRCREPLQMLASPLDVEPIDE